MSNRVYSVLVKPIVLSTLIVVAETRCGGGNQAGVTGATGGSTSSIGGMGGGEAATGGATVTGGGTADATATGGMQTVTGGTATTGGIARTGGAATAGGTRWRRCRDRRRQRVWRNIVGGGTTTTGGNRVTGAVHLSVACPPRAVPRAGAVQALAGPAQPARVGRDGWVELTPLTPTRFDLPGKAPESLPR